MIYYKNKSFDELLEEYNRYKSAYYNGEALISDDEFDVFEDFLVREYDFDPQVGSLVDSPRPKVKHWNGVLSLRKVKVANDFEQSHLDEIINIFTRHSEFGNGRYKLSYKLDGIAVSAKYSGGSLVSIATRGDKVQGEDITTKFRPIFPETINILKDVEVRCELVILVDVFDSKYKGTEKHQYRHARNFVAGVKNDLEIDDARVKDLVPVALDIVARNGDVLGVSMVSDYFEVVESSECTVDNVYDIYSIFASDRPNHIYLTDGLVIQKLGIEKREHDGKYPYGMVSIKFPPPSFVTTVISIEFKLSAYGKYIPIVIFKPFVVDGRSIERASGHNYANLLDRGISVGSVIQIDIANDIIPYISGVKEKNETQITIPEDAKFDGVHLYTETNELITAKRFAAAITTLGLFGFGDKTLEKLSIELGVTRLDEAFNISESDAVSAIGRSKGKSFVQGMAEHKRKGIHIKTLIRSLKVEHLGDSISEQLALFHSGLVYDDSGLNKAIMESGVGGSVYDMIIELVGKLTKQNIEIHYYQEVVEDENSDEIINYVMTGSPKEYGFATKAKFEATLPSNYKSQKGVNGDTNVLFTDKANGTSSKQKKANAQIAKRDNIKVVLYNMTDV